MAKQDTAPKPAPAKKDKPKPLTRAQAEKAMKDNKAAYDAYQVDRAKGVERSKNKHAEGYKAYKTAYRRLLDIKREAGEIKPREPKAAEPQSEAQGAPVEGGEGVGS